MFNLKTCAAAAGGTFLLSSLIGLIGGVDFFTVLLRAFIFGASAFGFVAGVQQLISIFLPDLAGGFVPESAAEDIAAEDRRGEQERMGEKIDVSVGDEDDDDLSQYAAPSEDAEEGARPASGLDQRTEGGYTEGEPSVRASAAAARPPDLIGNVDVLPDLEGFSDSFVTPISLEDSSERAEPRVSSSSAPASLSAGGGQFDAKEMAMAIQTILKRDQKG